MEILLHEQMKALRQKKGNTQEELATHLDISTQAVSKWERGERMPDITLLPGIAAYYNVTVDELLGVTEAKKQEKIEKYWEKSGVLNREGRTAEHLALWQEAEKEFPNTMEVLCQLMYAYFWTGKNEDAIRLGERILREDTEHSERESAVQVLCYANNAIGHKEEAEKYASMAGSYYVTTQELLKTVLDGEERIELCQNNLINLVELISRNINDIVSAGILTAAEKIRAHKAQLAFFEILYPDGDYGFYHCRLADTYKDLSCWYHDLADRENVLASLEKAAYHAEKYDTRTDSRRTSPLVNRTEDRTESVTKDYTGNDSALLFRFLEREIFDPYREDRRFTAIVEQVRRVAVQ
ncbi:MAG: helix-turn-helix transcriptional regulator [Clostridia bacterium]|nr:helix-turn-helix transcriptional regulator [Clostridia bacterium]